MCGLQEVLVVRRVLRVLVEPHIQDPVGHSKIDLFAEGFSCGPCVIVERMVFGEVGSDTAVVLELSEFELGVGCLSIVVVHRS